MRIRRAAEDILAALDEPVPDVPIPDPATMLDSTACGQRLKAARLAAGFASASAAARACGIHVTHYGDYERGKKMPTWPTLHRIAVGLKLDLAYLFPELADRTR